MIDLAIIAGYFIITLWIGLTASRRVRNLTEFSIGQRNFSVPVLVATLSGTLIGGGSTFGLAEKCFLYGPIFLFAYCGILIERIFTATLIADKMKPYFGLITAGDIMEKLYGKYAKIITGLATIATSIFIIGAHITTTGIILKSFFGLPLSISLTLSTVSILAYCSYGGIGSVSFTDVVQFAFMLISIPLVAVLSLMDAGGLSGIVASVPQSFFDIDAIATEVVQNHAVLFISYAVPALYPVIIQRMLMAKDTRQIKFTLWFNTALSLFFFTMIAIIGMAALVLYPSIDAKTAFPTLINELLPNGVKGLAIVGLLATVMSTVDSFLNLVSVSLVNDILRPLFPSKFTERNELAVARTTTVVIGTAGLISALYFNGVLENIFASMNLWLPFIFPPLFIGIWRGIGCRRSFLIGFAAASFTLLITNISQMTNGFFAALLASCANGLFLLMASPKVKRSNTTASFADWFRAYLKKLGLGIEQQIENADVLSVFSLAISTIPTITAVSAGVRPKTISMILFVSIASLATVFILKDLWITKRFFNTIRFLLPVLLITVHVSSPFIIIFQSGPTVLGVCDFIIGLFVIATLYANSGALLLNCSGILIALVLYPFLESASSLSVAIPMSLAFALRLLMLFYCFLKAKNKAQEAVKHISDINSAIAHEVGHSIASMNLCAKRLSVSLPKVLRAFQEAPNSKIYEVTKEDIFSLNALAHRLRENASRTESTVRILQQGDSDKRYEPASALSMVREAIDSGAPNIEQNHLSVTGDDFFLRVDRGAVVHVLINLLKNAAEALIDRPTPRIEISINRAAQTISVGNNGPQISQDHLSKLLKSRFSTKGKGRGSGLVTCSILLSRLNACMSLQSNDNFTVFILKFENQQMGAQL